MKTENSNRILFVIARGDAFGGSSLHVMDMASRLRDQGHTVKILVGGHPDMEVPRRFGARELNYLCIPEMGRKIHPVQDGKAIFAIRREIRKFAPDIVSLHSSKAGALGRIAALGLPIPVLYTPHCWSFVDGFNRASTYRKLEKALAPTATQIITVSEDEKLFGLECGVGRRDRFTTIHNGVKDAFFDRLEREPDPDGCVRIVMVGRFEEQKDQALLIRALSNLKHLPWKLTLVGEGPLRKDCIALAESAGLSSRIDFAGYSDQVETYLKTHDLFALITNWEGFPRSILEAMSASLPVIATDVGGSREAVHNRVSGRLVSRGNLGELTEALNELLSNPDALKEMGKAGRSIYTEEFTFHAMFSRYALLYREIIASHRERLQNRLSFGNLVRRLISIRPSSQIQSDTAKRV